MEVAALVGWRFVAHPPSERGQATTHNRRAGGSRGGAGKCAMQARCDLRCGRTGGRGSSGEGGATALSLFSPFSIRMSAQMHAFLLPFFS